MLIFCTKDCIEKPLYIYLANLTQRQTCFIQTLQAHLDEDLIHKGQCWCVCVYRNPNCWMDQDEIWYRGGPQGGGKVLGGRVTTRYPQPLGTRCVKGVRGASGAMRFDENFLKQKLLRTPDLVGMGHLFGPQIQIWKDLGLVSFWSLSSAFWLKFYNTKVAGHPQFTGGGSPYRTPNPDLERPGPSVTHFQGDFIK